VKVRPLIPVKRKQCGCWDCRRARGETPKMEGKQDYVDGEGYQRPKALFPGAGSGTIPPNSDITGADRPNFGKKKRRRR